MHFNEGKACDAVIRRIEAREGKLRHNVRFPEKEKHSGPVEIACSIGESIFAFEHTGIEPFEGHLELEAKAKSHFEPLQTRLLGRLPPNEHFVLHIPAAATLPFKLRELRSIHDALTAWIESTAPALPVARLDRYIIQTKYATLPGVPFEVALHRVQRGGPPGHLSIVHLLERNIEPQRTERIRRVYVSHTNKLEAWRKLGARTVLILEENDMFATNHQRVAVAVESIEQELVSRPDEIYLLSSASANPWYLWALRVDDHRYRELSTWGDSLSEIDSALLDNITGR